MDAEKLGGTLEIIAFNGKRLRSKLFFWKERACIS